MVAGGSVSAKQMRAVLDDRLWHSYQERLQQSRWEREMAETGREIFAEYNRKLRVANMLYGRWEQLPKLTSLGAVKLGKRVDSLYEDALEELQEILSSNRTAQMYIEDGYSDDPSESTISYCPDGMPRMIYRTSNIATRDELKLQVLTRAVADAENSYGIGEHDRRSGKILTADTQAFRLYHQRIEAIQKADDEKNFHKRLPTFSKLFGD